MKTGKLWKRRNRKQNNRGMTLVEVVVAIFILSVAILPVLHTFVSSAMYNARARRNQQTTAAAQTVLENFKAYSVKEICDQFAHIDGKNFAVSGGVAVTTQIVDPATRTLVSAPIAAGDMDFRIMGMVYQNEHYDVEINLRSHNSLAADMETLIYENRTSDNAAAYVGLQSMDADALSQIAEKVAEVWTAEERAAAPTPAPSAPPVPEITHSGSEVDTGKIKINRREITIDFHKSGDNYIAEVSCSYQYQVDSYQYGVSETGVAQTFSIPATDYDFDMDTARTELSKEIFNQPMAAEQDHLNLTVYYFPAYSRGTGSAVKVAHDQITIQNSTDKDIQCYLYKQKNMAVSDTRVSYSELGYHLNLSLSSHVSINDDNLNTVLGSPTSVAPGGYDAVNRNRGIGYIASNSQYPSGSDPAPALPTAAPTMADDMVENLRQMYDITVTVYSGGTLPVDGSVIPVDIVPLNTLRSTIIE